MKRYGPSGRRAENASAALRIFVRHPKKTFATKSVKNGSVPARAACPFDSQEQTLSDYAPKSGSSRYLRGCNLAHERPLRARSSRSMDASSFFKGAWPWGLGLICETVERSLAQRGYDMRPIVVA
jgi:hypothetical protein